MSDITKWQPPTEIVYVNNRPFVSIAGELVPIRVEEKVSLPSIVTECPSPVPIPHVSNGYCEYLKTVGGFAAVGILLLLAVRLLFPPLPPIPPAPVIVPPATNPSCKAFCGG